MFRWRSGCRSEEIQPGCCCGLDVFNVWCRMNDVHCTVFDYFSSFLGCKGAIAPVEITFGCPC
eukprot:m.1642416 g.1642416  ORF g.1642416 m.1642416 type:complete len:63 (-) comp52954_c0_seq1:106-294(-)